jgi:hypothetical protein
MLSKFILTTTLAIAMINLSFIWSRDHLTFVVQKKDDPTDQLLVFFPKDKSVGVKPLRV